MLDVIIGVIIGAKPVRQGECGLVIGVHRGRSETRSTPRKLAMLTWDGAVGAVEEEKTSVLSYVCLPMYGELRKGV
jgi:hypothetical protein